MSQLTVPTVADTLPAESAKMPRSVPYIIGNEAAERFSFYGMKAILTTYLAAQFFANTANPQAAANEQTHAFIAMTYLLPLVGGMMADWFLGKYRTILYLSIVYCLGHAFLAMFETNLTGLARFVAHFDGGRWYQAVRIGQCGRPIWQAKPAFDGQSVQCVLL